MLSKSGLAIRLSRLHTFSSPKLKLEQYPTDSEIAADLLWNAYMKNEISNKHIIDFGCGTGILGIGALLLGASDVTFIDIDQIALDILSKNLKSESLIKQATIQKAPITDITGTYDIVIQNPPFGAQQKHADKAFLLKAMQLAPVCYSLHNAQTIDFLQKITADNRFIITHTWNYNFPLKHSYAHQKRKIHRIEVIGIRIKKDHIK